MLVVDDFMLAATFDAILNLTPSVRDPNFRPKFFGYL